MSHDSPFEQFNTLGSAEADSSSNEIGLDTALLIAAATAKGINPALWLSENVDAGLRPFSDFSSRLISLGLAVGIQEDRDTKKELDHATSKASLRAIYRLCKAGKDGNGVLLVDVGLFLRLCNLKILEYIGLMQSQQPVAEVHNGPSERRSPSDEALNVEPAGVAPSMSSPTAGHPLRVPVPEVPPLSSPLPAFAKEHAEDAEDLNDRWADAEAKELECPSAKLPHPSPEPKAASVPVAELPSPLKGTLPPRPTRPSRQAPERRSATSVPGSLRQERSRTLDLGNSDPAFSILREVERLLRRTIRQTDLYHIVQVHLGFLSDKHCFRPPRGQVDCSYYCT